MEDYEHLNERAKWIALALMMIVVLYATRAITTNGMIS